jgi:signal transduction histidine kinase
MKNIYQLFAERGFLSRKYSLKFLFIAFMGVHIPLIVIIVSIAFGWIALTAWSIILLTLIATLVATGITLYLLHGLLWPIEESSKALHAYANQGHMPNLPIHYPDEAGVLLKQIQLTIDSIDALIKERKDLLSLLSHDLRSPLSQLHGIGELLRNNPSPEDVEQYGKMITHVCTTQLSFINDIVQLLEVDNSSGQHSLQLYERKGVREIVTEAIDLQTAFAGRKQVSIEVIDFPDVSIKCNKRLLVQAISNIIGNAIKFSYRGHQVLIKVHQFSGHLHLVVADSGIGFENGKAEMIFQKFTPEGKTGTEGEQSTGMGLYLTRKIIQNHNGMIAAFSEGINKGAVMTIQLPLTS